MVDNEDTEISSNLGEHRFNLIMFSFSQNNYYITARYSFFYIFLNHKHYVIYLVVIHKINHAASWESESIESIVVKAYIY